MPGPFAELLADLALVRENRAAGQAHSQAVDEHEDWVTKAFEFADPRAMRERRTQGRAAISRGKSELEKMRADLAASSAEVEQMRKEAQGPGPEDFAHARSLLAKAIGSVPALEIARMQARINMAERQSFMGKALEPMSMPDDRAENVQSNRARALHTSTDTHAQITRARHLMRELRTSGKISPQDAARFEQRINRAESDESAVMPADPSRQARMAATNRASSILHDMATSGKLTAVEVAGYEAQIHHLQRTFGIAPEPDPMVA